MQYRSFSKKRRRWGRVKLVNGERLLRPGELNSLVVDSRRPRNDEHSVTLDTLQFRGIFVIAKLAEMDHRSMLYDDGKPKQTKLWLEKHNPKTLSRITEVQVCDARDDDGITEADNIKK